MSNAPYLSKKYRSGARIGHDTVYDHMMLDGLEDAYDKGRAMGTFAEDAAREYQFTREQQDELCDREPAPRQRGDHPRQVRQGDRPGHRRQPQGRGHGRRRRAAGQGQSREDPAAEARLRQGRHDHRGDRSSISDGAAALVLTRQSVADKLGKKPVARVVAHAAHAQEPAKFTTAPVPAIQKVLDKAGWTVDDVDLFEVNEAFACVAMIAMRDLGIPHDKINVNGGATALGHPIGASGARILTTLIAALQDRGLKRGIAIALHRRRRSDRDRGGAGLSPRMLAPGGTHRVVSAPHAPPRGDSPCI